MSVDDLRQSDMMAHLLDALDEGQDIGHYGKLVFAMVARHFLDEDELVSYLTAQPGHERGGRARPRPPGAGPRLQPAAARAHPGVAVGTGVSDLPDAGRPRLVQRLSRSSLSRRRVRGHLLVPRAEGEGGELGQPAPYQGSSRLVWARPISAAARALRPAPTRTPSSMRATTFSGVTVLRKAMPAAWQAARIRARAATISAG